MKAVFYWVLFIPLFVHAQVDTGVHFENGLSWSQAREKAKKENKDIFLDCYATWCVPCRLMEKQVYPNAEVGRYINKHFISVKVQMNKTNGDDEETQKWYRDAASLQANFSINAFPSFLFLTAEGKPIHKAVGYKDAQQFIASARDAFDTNRQYYRILSHFQPGKMDTSELKGLAREFRLSDPELAGEMAADYLTRIGKASREESDNLRFMAEFNGSSPIQKLAVEYFESCPPRELFVPGNFPIIAAFRKVPDVENVLLGYLSSLPRADIGTKNILNLVTLFKEEPRTMSFVDRYIRSLDTTELFLKGNIRLMESFTVSSIDPGFSFFFHCRHRVDSAMNIGGYAKYVVDNIIQREEIKHYCKDMRDGTSSPDWNAIATTISRKYGTDYARRDLLYQQSAFYGYRASKYDRDWPEYIYYTMNLIQTVNADPDTAVKLSDSWLNDFFYDGIFKRSNDTNLIRTVLNWSGDILKRDNYMTTAYIDTYASLLYKIGDRNDAIRQEQNALKIAESGKDEYDSKIFEKTLAKMKNGERIWITDSTDTE
ncbi:MAG: DUF255 domain-containing protein [Puia sp.]|nr:DUF255 domain-containing protein [Puia sp.]